MSRRVATAVISIFFVCGVIFASLSLLKPQKPPALPKAAVVHPPLTQHLLFVIVDGLRYDIATNSERMPRFSEAMHRYRSADIMAGPVSMTSSAVQTFASGQRGRLEQVARNINPDPPPFQSWMQNARDQGLRVSLVGDRTWQQMYGSAFTDVHLDPPGVAIDYDYNDLTLRDARAVLAQRPDAFVLHFVTPDHQGHAYGIQSDKYRKHITNFDRLLFELLAEVGPEWTVIVTSDHGANDAGDHGGDVLIHRRSPIFAYGPGIAAKGAESPKLDQVDVPGTLAALLGVPAPCHSQGHLLTDWLAVSPAERAAIATNDVRRLLTFAGAIDPEGASELTAELEQARRAANGDGTTLTRDARRLASEADRLLRSQQGVFSARAWWYLGCVTLGAALVTWLWLGPFSVMTVAWAALACVVSVLLTALVERLPGNGPKIAPAVLFGVLNIPTLLLLVKPERLVALLNRYRSIAAVAVPGVLAVTYPRNLQPVAFAVSVIVPLIVLAAPALGRFGFGRGAARPERGLDLLCFVVWALALFPAGWYPDGLPSLAVSRHTGAVLAVGLLLTVGFVLELWRRAPRAARGLAALGTLVLASLILRRYAPPWLGRSAMIGFPLLAIWPLLKGRAELALLTLLAGYAWVSRDIELPTVAAALGLASLVGRRAASAIELAKPGHLLVLLAFWFTLAFVVRLGLSGGIDPTHLDLQAGAFGDRAVSAAWIGFSVIWKNLIVLTLLGAVLCWALPATAVSAMARGFAAIGACRAAVLLGMMQLAQGSFWTSMRVIGDLPYTMLFFTSAGLSWLVYHHMFADSETMSASGFKLGSSTSG